MKWKKKDESKHWRRAILLGLIIPETCIDCKCTVWLERMYVSKAYSPRCSDCYYNNFVASRL